MLLFSVAIVVPVASTFVALIVAAGSYSIYHHLTKEKQVVYWYSTENETCSSPVSLWQYRLDHYKFEDRPFGPASDEGDEASKSGTESQETQASGKMIHVQGCLEQSWFRGAGNSSVEAFTKITKACMRQDSSLELLFLNADKSIETVQRLLYEELCQRHSLRDFKPKPFWFVCWSTMQTGGHDNVRTQAAEQFYKHLDSLTSATNNKISPYADEDSLYKRAYEATVLELQESNVDVDVGQLCLAHYTTENQLLAWTNLQPFAWNNWFRGAGNNVNSTSSGTVAAMIDDLTRPPAKDTYAKRWSEGLGVSVDYITEELENEAGAAAKEFYNNLSRYEKDNLSRYKKDIKVPVTADEVIADPNFYEISKCFCEGAKGKGFGKLCPRDGEMHCSVVDALDALDKKKAGRATHFLSWTWAYSVATFARTIGGWVERQQEGEAELERKQEGETKLERQQRGNRKMLKSSEIFLWV